MDIISSIKSDLLQLKQDESALLAKQVQIEQQLNELRVKMSVISQIIDKYDPAHPDNMTKNEEAREMNDNASVISPVRTRMSSRQSAEIWKIILDYLSDGELKKMADIKQTVDAELGFEVKRTTIQSLLRRGSDSIENPEKGYYRRRSDNITQG